VERDSLGHGERWVSRLRVRTLQLDCLTIVVFSVHETPLALYGTQLERCKQNLSELKYSSVAEHSDCDRITSCQRNKIIILCTFL